MALVLPTACPQAVPAAPLKALIFIYEQSQCRIGPARLLIAPAGCLSNKLGRMGPGSEQNINRRGTAGRVACLKFLATFRYIPEWWL